MGDGIRQHFISKERDTETGLDYFSARYFSSTQGRFTQVDPAGMSATSLLQPQTLNLYAYCGNDPVNRTDSDGLGLIKALKRAFKRLFHAFVHAASQAAISFITTGNFHTAVQTRISTFLSDIRYRNGYWTSQRGTPPTFPAGGVTLSQISQGTILGNLFPSAGAYGRWATGWAGGNLFSQLSGIDEAAAREALNTCTQALFGVTLLELVPSSRGKGGSFRGVQAGRDPQSQSITIFNDVTSFNRRGLRNLSRRFNRRAEPRIIGATIPTYIHTRDLASVPSGFSSYRNYTARDLAGDQIQFLNVQIHELGNSLSQADITGRHYTDLSDGEGDPDSGHVLEKCFRTLYFGHYP